MAVPVGRWLSFTLGHDGVPHRDRGSTLPACRTDARLHDLQNLDTLLMGGRWLPINVSSHNFSSWRAPFDQGPIGNGSNGSVLSHSPSSRV